MTRKKIRYSELTGPAPTAKTQLTPVSVPVVTSGPAAPRTRRNSAPIELARALATARATEARQVAETLAHVEARAAAAHARDLAASEAEAAAREQASSAPVAAQVAARVAEQVQASAPLPAPVALIEAAPATVAIARDVAEDESDEPEEWDAPEERGPRRPLRERARSRSGTAELLMFRIGAERFAVELVCVEEAIDLPEVHHVPEMPPAMLGVVTVRDTLTPVYTPEGALGVPVESRSAALVFRSERGRFALAIDDVDDVMTLDLALLRDAPGVDSTDSVVLGVVRNGGVIVGLVDADALILACQAIPALELV